ncbi:helix-turn-helix transcriptional regulator [Rhodococcus sp. NPDC127530]|uniref:helix-turn-helix transcriptional regulator n=1 Tax=unclassified Rhodococcus (in: high G+C Gram-positive bacteria) TaxID=192944 RepID=UPI00363A4470
MKFESEIREFLVTRRSKVRPEDVGLAGGTGSRRVPGLRREEVAELAAISTDYYIRLERGRLKGVSESVIDAVARALQLDDAERAHLFALTSAGAQIRNVPPSQPRHVRPSLLRLLDVLDGVPAMIQGHRTDVLAMNPLANVLYMGLGTLPNVADRNIARFVYLDDRSTEFYADWLQSARDCVAMLRFASGNNPQDRQLVALIGELSVRSEHFRQLWAEHDVRNHSTGTKTLHNPIVGEVTVTYEAMRTGESGHTLVTYTAEANSPSADALKLLASWAATHADNDIASASQRNSR